MTIKTDFSPLTLWDYQYSGWHEIMREHISASASQNWHGLFVKQFTHKDTPLSFRVLSHWSSIGLIEDTREKNNSAWRKLSILDRCWIDVLLTMRRFGNTLEHMKRAQTGLFSAAHEDEINPFGIAVTLAMMKKPVFIIVFADGTARYASGRDLAINDQLLQFPAYLRISLNDILGKIFPENDYLPARDDIGFTAAAEDSELSKMEQRVIEVARSGKYESLHLVMKDGKIERMNKRRRHDPNQKIVELLQDIKYGKLDIQIEQKRIVSLVSEEKEILAS